LGPKYLILWPKLSILGFKSFSYVKFDYDTFKICRIQKIHERLSLFGLVKNNKKNYWLCGAAEKLRIGDFGFHSETENCIRQKID
jgi:hypothetical protein